MCCLQFGANHADIPAARDSHGEPEPLRRRRVGVGACGINNADAVCVGMRLFYSSPCVLALCPYHHLRRIHRNKVILSIPTKTTPMFQRSVKLAARLDLPIAAGSVAARWACSGNCSLAVMTAPAAQAPASATTTVSRGHGQNAACCDLIKLSCSKYLILPLPTVAPPAAKQQMLGRFLSFRPPCLGNKPSDNAQLRST